MAGFALALLIGPIIKTKFRIYDLPILGLAASTFYAEIWSLFGRIDFRCVYSLLILSGAGILIATRLGKACLEQTPIPSRRALFVFLAFSILVALNSATRMKHGDSGLYHLNSIRWLEEWGSVPGLANLHARLGFNCSLFAAVALFDGLFPAAQLANGIVVVGSAIYIFGCLAAIRFDFRGQGFPFLAAAFGGLLFAGLAKFSSSPSPDVSQSALAICTLAVACEVFILEKQVARDSVWRSIVLLAAIASLHARFKASGIGLAGAAVICAGFALVLKLEDPRSRVKAYILGIALFSGSLLPWLARGYITSGYPLFPSTLFGAPVDWKVPESLAVDEANWIYSWARNPGPPWAIVLADNQWMGPWLRRNSIDLTVRWIIPFWLISFGILVCSMAAPDRSLKQLFPLWKFLCTLPVFFGVALWFLTAPDPRFSEGLLWTAGLAILLFGIQSGPDRLPKKRSLIYLLLIAAPVFFMTMSELARLTHEKRLFPVKYRAIQLKQRITNNGVTIWLPRTGGQVGDSPLPATVENRYQPDLEYRGKSLREGFRIKGGIPLIAK
jgi:hypothetical protein